MSYPALLTEFVVSLLPKDSLLFNQRGSPDVTGDGSLLRYDKKGKGRAQQNGDILAMDLISAEEGVPNQNGGAFMQMQLVEQQVSPSINKSSCLFLTRTAGRLYSKSLYRD